MKIVLTGCTGFIGNEILQQCIEHHYITDIYALTRKPLDRRYSTHRKVTEVQHDNFDDLPDYLFERLRGCGVEGCIWALGAKMQPNKPDEAERVGIKYPTQAAEGFAKHIAPRMMDSQTGKNVKPFRFVFISGWGAEQNYYRKLWVWNDWRKMKGAAEKGLFDVGDFSQEKHSKKCLEVTALRAGTALAKGDGLATIVAMGTMPCIGVDRLARCAIRVVLDGDVDGRKVLENKDCFGDDWAQVNTLT